MIRVLLFWLALAGAAMAVEPDEMLDDPVLEDRAREISKGLRCLVCRNESIDESHAELARDLRILVRERLVEGDSDEEVVEYLVSRFGEYVLLTPRADGVNLLLWWAAPALLLAGLGIAAFHIRRRRDVTAPEGLSEAEAKRLAELTRE